eukprot:1790635-Prymnesium_polylepis.1
MSEDSTRAPRRYDSCSSRPAIAESGWPCSCPVSTAAEAHHCRGEQLKAETSSIAYGLREIRNQG